MAPVLALALLTLLRLAVAGALPLSADEAYYWVWSRALAPGYLDHPPMVALWIAAGTALLGDGALGVRLLAPLAAAAGSLLLASAARDLLPGRHAGVTAAVLLNATLVLGVGSVTMTPDTPLLLFWTATLAALARLHATADGRWWLAAGAAAGLALDSKYTAALLAPAILGWVLAVPALRPWLARWQPWAAAALAAALFAPVLAWNATHGWASFLRQGGRAADWRPARAAQFLGELIGGQVGLATPLLAVLFAAGLALALRRAWRRDPAWGLLAWFALLPALVFVQHALGDRVQANWPGVCYPAAAIAAAGLSARWRGWRVPAVGLGGALVALIWVQGIAAPLPLPRAADPTLIRLGGWDGLAAQVAEAAARDGAAFVAVDGYGLAAMLARTLPGRIPVLGADPRWHLFALRPAAPGLQGRPGLLVRSERLAGPPDLRAWAGVTPAGEVVRARGVTAERYRLYHVLLAAAPGAVLLPHRR